MLPAGLIAVRSHVIKDKIAAHEDDDRRLAMGCAAGDSSIFEDIYRRFGDRMKSIAYNHLGSVPDARSSTGNVIKVLESIDPHRRSVFYTWINGPINTATTSCENESAGGRIPIDYAWRRRRGQPRR